MFVYLVAQATGYSGSLDAAFSLCQTLFEKGSWLWKNGTWFCQSLQDQEPKCGLD